MKITTSSKIPNKITLDIQNDYKDKSVDKTKLTAKDVIKITNNS